MDDLLEKRRLEYLKKVIKYFKDSGKYYLLDSDENDYINEYIGSEVWTREIYANNEFWDLHIIFSETFPDSIPQVRVPGAKNLYLKNPHIMIDGFICVLPNTSRISINNYIEVINELIKSTIEILENKLNTDFKAEFESYWNLKTNNPNVQSLIVDAHIEKKVELYTFISKSRVCISANQETLNLWRGNILGRKVYDKYKKNCIVIKLNKTLIPNDFPDNIYSLLQLAKEIDETNYRNILYKLLKDKSSNVVLLVQEIDDGYNFATITFKGLSLNTKKYSNGFRNNKIPLEVLMSKSSHILQKTPIQRIKTTRVDYSWIHSRGGSGVLLEGKKVTLIGCGSLGSYVAHFLVKSGISKLSIIDKETLEWENIGRHILGSQYIGKSKAISVCSELRKEMPHLQIDSYNDDWRSCYIKYPNLLEESDIIVSTTAEWEAEKPLNYMKVNSLKSPIIFSWLEPYATSGHSFFIYDKSPCLDCIMDEFGNFKYSVSSFFNDVYKKEPGGCTYYQQYGISALIPTATMITQQVLDFLLLKIENTELRTWISNLDHFQETEATINDFWIKKIDGKGYSSIYNSTLKANSECETCVS